MAMTLVTFHALSPSFFLLTPLSSFAVSLLSFAEEILVVAILLACQARRPTIPGKARTTPKVARPLPTARAISYRAVKL